MGYANEFWNERQPDRAKENSPPIHRWVTVRKPDESRQGRQSRIVVSNIFFRPTGALAFFTRDPRLKPWAIFGRPCRDFATARKARYLFKSDDDYSGAVITRYIRWSGRPSVFG